MKGIPATVRNRHSLRLHLLGEDDEQSVTERRRSLLGQEAEEEIYAWMAKEAKILNR